MASINFSRRPLRVNRAGEDAWVGVAIAWAIFVAWFSTLVWLCTWDLAECSVLLLVLGVGVRTFLHTGLFAIAHDAIHGNLLPQFPSVNRCFGQLALRLYGCLSYDTCRQLHWQHHRFTAEARDPDFHEVEGDGPFVRVFRWYCKFLATYISSSQLVSIVAGVVSIGIVFIAAKLSLQSLFLFWLLPWCLSSVQLFFFGTYLPHHSDRDGALNRAARSYYFPEFWSLLACYHFGYHWEHHAYPHIPWYRLPQAAKFNCDYSGEQIIGSCH